MTLKHFGFAAIAVLCLMLAVPAKADITLTDGNASVTITPDVGSGGITSFIVDGKENLGFEWFWIRRGGLNTPQTIDSFDDDGIADITVNGANSVTITYLRTSTGDFQIDLTLTLTYNALGDAVLQKDMTITNLLDPSTLAGYKVFQYSDFNLAGQTGNQTTQYTSNPGVSGTFTQLLGVPCCAKMENQVVPEPTRYGTGDAATELAALTTTVGYNLNNTTSFGPGDASYLFQWDLAAYGGQSVNLGSAQAATFIPEPGTIGLMGGALVLIGALRRRARR